MCQETLPVFTVKTSPLLPGDTNEQNCYELNITSVCVWVCVGVGVYLTLVTTIPSLRQ